MDHVTLRNHLENPVVRKHIRSVRLRFRPEVYRYEEPDLWGRLRIIFAMEMDGVPMTVVMPNGAVNPLVWVTSVCYN